MLERILEDDLDGESFQGDDRFDIDEIIEDIVRNEEESFEIISLDF